MISRVKKLSRSARGVPAGLTDAGLASLAHFLVGLAAVNLMGSSDRGVYAVFFAAFLVAGVVPQYLIYTPAEVIAVSHDREHRLDQFRQSLLMGVGPTLVGASALVIAAIATADDTTPEVTYALMTTSILAILVSPAQDHVRRLLHIAKHSWNAAAVSTAQLVVVAIMLTTLIAIDVPVAWVPFGSLMVANIVSLSLGLILAKRHALSDAFSRLRFRELAVSGRWLLAMGLLPFVSGLIGSILIVKIAGAVAMGYAEAARVAAQPILVLAMGLGAVLGPRGMEAGMRVDIKQAHRAHRAYLALIVGIGFVYLLFAGFDWPGNLMVALVPSAYVISGLTAVTIVANIVTSAASQFTREMMGARREARLTKMALISSPFILVGAATAGTTGSFARPIGLILAGSIRYVMYGFARKRIYTDAVNPDSSTHR
jgi:O-antigen/teichoic acid export membrane protein